MENKTVEKGKQGRKAGLTTMTLPWWARVLIAQEVDAAFPVIDAHIIWHCSVCGPLLISSKFPYLYFSDICPECSTENRSTQGGY